ncbi:MAG: hypothetical protein QOE28_1496, partial [Solirubrobacteraceae bacterium]|nr:hypothetical protein [Solirubrobacteraceae bacterium]
MRLGRVALIAILLGALALSAGARSSGAVFVAASPQAADTFSAAADFNTVVASLSDPGTPLRGTVSLSASATSDRGIATVVFQSSPAGAGTWSTICTVASAPYTCNFNTTAVADGLRDVRIVATDSAGYSKTPTIANRRVDNTAPASGMTNPGTPLRGTVTLNATGSDGGSGLASLTIQRSPAGAGTWTTVCTTATSPASCSLDTTTVADGLYDLRATATDAAGNATTSTVTSRRIDNTAPTVTMTDPGASVAGTITLQSTNADAGSGVATVAYQYRTSPAGAWTSACSAASSCSWSTASVADGLYDFRATATDGAGNATTSAVISSRRIDNTVPSSATMVDPGTPLSGTVALSGTAADAGSGVATLLFQYAPAGTSTWATACSSAASPYGCNWDTTAIADGVYDMRALATDGAGNQLASATRSNRRVDNVAPAVSLTDP